MNKEEVLGKFQRLGKVLMTPVLILPIAGILVGLGNAFTSKSLIAVAPWLGTIVPTMIFTLCKVAGNVVMGNIPAIFAICVAYGFAKSEKATATLCGFLGYMTMNTVMGTFLTTTGVIDPANLATGQSSILGVSTLDTGVIGGLAVGALVAWLHNRYYKIELPPVLSIFNGTRFIPAVTLLFCTVLGLLMSFVSSFVLGILVFSFGEIPVLLAAGGTPEYDADWLIVLGAGVNGDTPSLSMLNRLTTAKAYLDAHPDCRVIVSGGQGDGENITEAEAMRRWLTAQGLDPARIVCETRSESTEENIAFSLSPIPDLERARVAVCSSEYHLYRAQLLGRRMGCELGAIPARTTLPVLRINYFIREGLGALYYFILAR